MSVTSESFLRDVAQHRMTIKMDEGLYRHLVFRNPATFNQWFEIITWPGKLAISGDMGSWIFARVDDMFTFYRGPLVARGNGLKINPDYWAQKIEAEDNCCGTRAFDVDHFVAAAVEDVENNWGLDDAAAAAQDLREHLIGDESREEMYSRLRDWEWCEAGGYANRFDEIPDGMVFTARFLWCCHAIVWAIQQYDAAKEAR